jgi:Pvc16 N-terminal domain
MSSYNVLSVVNKALSSLLWDAISQDPTLSGIVPNQSAIVFSNPTETARQSSNRLSIWLYQVTENEFVKNQPVVRVNGGTGLALPPLTLNLHFLITPFGATPDANLLLLGELMHVLYDNAIVLIRDADNGVSEEMRIMLSRLTLEELTHVWYALMEPYRLSVCYEVRVMHIDSRRITDSARVFNLTQALGGVPQGENGSN